MHQHEIEVVAEHATGQLAEKVSGIVDSSAAVYTGRAPRCSIWVRLGPVDSQSHPYRSAAALHPEVVAPPTSSDWCFCAVILTVSVTWTVAACMTVAAAVVAFLTTSVQLRGVLREPVSSARINHATTSHNLEAVWCGMHWLSLSPYVSVCLSLAISL